MNSLEDHIDEGHSRWPIVAVVLYVAVVLGWQMIGHPGDRVLIGDLVLIPVDVFAACLAWSAGTRSRGLPSLQLFWRLFALALTANAVGDAAMAAYDLGSSPAPFPSPADPAYLSFYALVGLALWRLPVAPTTAAQRRRAALDVATVVLGGTMVVWYLVLAPTILEGSSTAIQMAVSIAYPLGDLTIVAGVSLAALHWTPVTVHRSLAWIAAGLVLFVAADVAYGYAQLHGGYTAGAPMDLLWVVAMGLFALAALEQRRVQAGDVEAATPSRPQGETRVSWLPFAGLLLGSAILLDSQWDAALAPDLILIVVVIALATLIAIRQYVAQSDLLRADRELRSAHRELARLASHDPLTGLPNRRSLKQTLDEELQRARRYGRPLSILFLDIDRFKRINDEHGHDAGDDALCEFAGVVNESLRPVDRAGRWGGEEFIVVMPETEREQAKLAAERIRRAVERHPFGFAPDAALSCSIGVSSYPADGLDAQALFHVADDAVYEAKRKGRNRVFVATGAAS
jgi:diguanylate cyclase (GGDEF)-like protein